MRKSARVIVAFLIISAVAAISYGVVNKRSPLGPVVSMYADGTGGYYYIEVKNSKYSYYHLDEDGEIKAYSRIRSLRSEYFYSCNGIIADADGNVYIAVYEKDGLQRIHSKYVQVFDKKGKMLKRIFETRLDGVSEKETLKSLQYVEGKVSMFEMLGPGRLLRYEYDCNTSVERTVEYVIYDGGPMVEATYTKKGEIFFTTNKGGVFRISASHETERLDVTYDGVEKVVPLRLSYNDGSLYFTDVHNFAFVKYDLAEKRAVRLLNEDDDVGCGEMFRNMDFVRWYNGGLYGHTTVLYSEGFLMRLSGEPCKIDSKERSVLSVFISGARDFTAVFIVLMLTAGLVRLVIRSRSLFVKQILILSVLMSMPILLIAVLFNKTFKEQIANETYYQLYTLATEIAANIDGGALKKLDFPNDVDSEFIKDLDKKINVEMEGFRYPYEDSIPKNLFYTIYTVKDETAYFAYGLDYISGMRDEYMLGQAREFFENNAGYRPKSLEYRNKYGVWVVYRAFVMDGEEPVGLVEIGTRRDMVDQKVLELTVKNAVAAMLTALGGIFVLGVALRRLLKGLESLKYGLGQITDGNWHVRVNISSGDEIEDIANDFNRMSSRIEKYVDSITRLNSAYKSFVPNELFELLDKKTIFDVELGDQAYKNINLMSVSIKEFYSISKRTGAQECFEILNSVFAASSQAIRKKGGFIESFGGFGLRAVFTDGTGAAIDSALRIIEKIGAYNKESELKIYLNITIQNGDSMIGIAGDHERMAETVISETAGNIPALERITESHNINLLVTESAFERLESKERHNYCRIGRIKSESGYMWLYDFIDSYAPEKRAKRTAAKVDFEKGLGLYMEGRFQEARKSFADVLKLDGEYEIAKLYLFLCENGDSRGDGFERAVIL